MTVSMIPDRLITRARKRYQRIQRDAADDPLASVVVYLDGDLVKSCPRYSPTAKNVAMAHWIGVYDRRVQVEWIEADLEFCGV